MHEIHTDTYFYMELGLHKALLQRRKCERAHPNITGAVLHLTRSDVWSLVPNRQFRTTQVLASAMLEEMHPHRLVLMCS